MKAPELEQYSKSVLAGAGEAHSCNSNQSCTAQQRHACRKDLRPALSLFARHRTLQSMGGITLLQRTALITSGHTHQPRTTRCLCKSVAALCTQHASEMQQYLPVISLAAVKLSQRKQLVDDQGKTWHDWVQVREPGSVSRSPPPRVPIRKGQAPCLTIFCTPAPLDQCQAACRPVKRFL